MSMRTTRILKKTKAYLRKCVRKQTKPGPPMITNIGQTTDSYYNRIRSRPDDQTTRNRRTGYDSSSEDDYYDQTYVIGLEDKSTTINIVPFHSRPVGPTHIGIRSKKPANKTFDKLMSYQSYRLMITKDRRSSRDTADVRVHIKNLNLTMKNHVLNGNDPIKIFDSLTRFINEVDMLQMSEAQAFIAIPTFLAEPAETQFGSNLSGASRHGGITC